MGKTWVDVEILQTPEGDWRYHIMVDEIMSVQSESGVVRPLYTIYWDHYSFGFECSACETDATIWNGAFHSLDTVRQQRDPSIRF